MPNQYFPSLGTLPELDAVVQLGRGVEAAILGQTYSVYRLNPSSSGQLVQPSNLVLTGYPAIFQRITVPKDIEANWMIKVPIYKATCDATFLQFGDLLLEEGFGSDGGAFTYVWRRPAGLELDNIFIGTPVPSQITRPDNNPARINVGEVAYEGEMKEYELPLVLESGSFFFSTDPEAIPTTIYAAIYQHERGGEYRTPAERLPEDVKRQPWHVFCYLLKGTELVENDIVTGANGDRYRIVKPFWQPTNLRGYQLGCDRRLA